MKKPITKIIARALLPLSFVFANHLSGHEWFYSAATPWLYSTSSGNWNYMTPSFYYGANSSYYIFDSARPVQAMENRWLYFVEPFWLYDTVRKEWIIFRGTWGYEYSGSGGSSSAGQWRVYFDPLGEETVPSTLPIETEITISYFSSSQLISFKVVYVPNSGGGMAYLTPGDGVNTPDEIDALGWNEPVPATYTKINDAAAQLELDSLGVIIELKFHIGRSGSITFYHGEESWGVNYSISTGFGLGLDYYKFKKILE